MRKSHPSTHTAPRTRENTETTHCKLYHSCSNKNLVSNWTAITSLAQCQLVKIVPFEQQGQMSHSLPVHKRKYRQN